MFKCMLSFILKPIDAFLNAYTMYRVVLNSLIAMTVWAVVLIGTGQISYSISAAVLSLLILVVGSFLLNIAVGKLLSAPINMESSVITGLILFLIFSPPSNARDVYMLISAAAIATLSKYVFAIKKKHLFNPAAIAAFTVPLIGFDGASWWVATPLLTPFILVLGLLVVRKIRRFSLFFAFVIAAIVSITITNWSFINSGFMTYPQLLREVLTSWPLLFFATIMLTEPYTMPHKQNLQIIFGVIVGLLFGARFHVGPFFSTPETALIIGNVFAYLVSPKQKLFLTLQKKEKLSSSMHQFYFSKPENFTFEAGQYMEWTLPLEKNIDVAKKQFPDSRGNRRFFTIASAPAVDTIQLGVKIPQPSENPSFYKQALAKIKPGDTVIGSQLGGDFVLPKNLTQYSQIIFIAGGIGVTPFKSMVEQLHSTRPTPMPSITLFYCSSSVEEFVYKDTFENKESQTFLKPIYVLTRPENAPKQWQQPSTQWQQSPKQWQQPSTQWQQSPKQWQQPSTQWQQPLEQNYKQNIAPAYELGRLNEAMLKKYVKKPTVCLYYLSGPNAMVEGYKSLLHKMKVPQSAIKTDYFPGF
jgi:ferredoxin-NADP reductase